MASANQNAWRDVAPSAPGLKCYLGFFFQGYLHMCPGMSINNVQPIRTCGEMLPLWHPKLKQYFCCFPDPMMLREGGVFPRSMMDRHMLTIKVAFPRLKMNKDWHNLSTEFGFCGQRHSLLTFLRILALLLDLVGIVRFFFSLAAPLQHGTSPVNQVTEQRTSENLPRLQDTNSHAWVHQLVLEMETVFRHSQ